MRGRRLGGLAAGKDGGLHITLRRIGSSSGWAMHVGDCCSLCQARDMLTSASATRNRSQPPTRCPQTLPCQRV